MIRNVCCAALLLAAFAGTAMADISLQQVLATRAGGSCCTGTYYAFAKMTNSSGAFWIVPPTNTLTGTFQDASGFPAPYSSVVSVTRKIDVTTWCSTGTNSLTFPATNSSYLMTVYVLNSSGIPTNGQPMVLQVQWQ